MPDVSIIVPTRNAAGTLEACLISARDQRGASVELIVVDNHSDDATPAIARAHADLVLTLGPERSAQRNAGAAAARGEVVLIVDADMTLDPDVAAQTATAFSRDPRLGAVVIPELAAGVGFWADCRKLEKHLYLGRPDVEAARGFRRAAYLAVGGYDEALTGMEDWDLPDRVVAAGWGLGRIDAPVHHHETVSTLRELFSKKRYYGRGSANHFLAGRLQRPWWRPSLVQRPSALARHPALATGMFTLKAVEAAGIAYGMWEQRRRGAAEL